MSTHGEYLELAFIRDNKIEVQEDVVENLLRLENENMPFAIYTVLGPSSKKNSSYFKKMLKHLSEKDGTILDDAQRKQISQFGKNNNSAKASIVAWSKPFFITKEFKKIAIFLIGIHGNFKIACDPSYIMLSGLCTFMSSFVIYIAENAPEEYFRHIDNIAAEGLRHLQKQNFSLHQKIVVLNENWDPLKCVYGMADSNLYKKQLQSHLKYGLNKTFEAFKEFEFFFLPRQNHAKFDKMQARFFHVTFSGPYVVLKERENLLIAKQVINEIIKYTDDMDHKNVFEGSVMNILNVRQKMLAEEKINKSKMAQKKVKTSNSGKSIHQDQSKKGILSSLLAKFGVSDVDASNTKPDATESVSEMTLRQTNDRYNSNIFESNHAKQLVIDQKLTSPTVKPNAMETFTGSKILSDKYQIDDIRGKSTTSCLLNTNKPSNKNTSSHQTGLHRDENVKGKYEEKPSKSFNDVRCNEIERAVIECFDMSKLQSYESSETIISKVKHNLRLDYEVSEIYERYKQHINEAISAIILYISNMESAFNESFVFSPSDFEDLHNNNVTEALSSITNAVFLKRSVKSKIVEAKNIFQTFNESKILNINSVIQSSIEGIKAMYQKRMSTMTVTNDQNVYVTHNELKDSILQTTKNYCQDYKSAWAKTLLEKMEAELNIEFENMKTPPASHEIEVSKVEKDTNLNFHSSSYKLRRNHQLPTWNENNHSVLCVGEAYLQNYN